MSCYVCADDPAGCERCRGGPGEQGLSHDEKELLELRERVRVVEAELTRVALEWVPQSIVDKAVRDAYDIARHKVLDAVMHGFMGDPRSTMATEAALRELVRSLR